MSLFIISPIDLATTYRALAALFNAGVGPTHALSFIEESTECRPLKGALKRLSALTADGTPLSAATAEYPKIFPVLHRTVLAAGEASGLMPAALTGLAEMVERDHALKQSVRRELMPTKMNLGAIVLLILFLVILGALHWDQISLSTRFLLGIFIVISGVAFAAATLLVQVNNEAEVRFGGLVNRVPAIGKLARMMSENHFTRVLAVCHEAGILPMRSITLAAEACGSPSLQRQLMAAVPLVKDGKTMAESLDETKSLSDYLISMLKVGEESGKVTETLYRSQEYQAGVIEGSLHQIKTYVSVFSNLAVLGLGATVVFMCYGVL